MATGIDVEILAGSVPALLLQSISSLNIPSSLIVPRVWFGAGRKIEMLWQNGKKQRVRMGFSVEYGTDFERISFDAV